MSTTDADEDPTLISLQEACDRLGIAPSTLRRRAERGELTIVNKPGRDKRRRYVPAADLDAYLEGRS